MDKFIDTITSLGLTVNERQAEQFEIFYRELIDWNRRISLTAITDYEDVQVKHFLDSLTVILALKRIPGPPVYKVIDIGTGAGFPGIPLKIMLPEIHLTLLEATGKKTRFLEYITHALKLTGVEILKGRAEDFGRSPEYRECFNIVLSRAVAALPSLVELALPFCTIGGCFIAQKQTDVGMEIEQAHNAVRLLGGRLREIIDISFPKFSGGRCLVVYDKISPTPPAYPRRPGIPGKKPLQ
jgi:16S rRNA (guanine527-N7)-methyltransferase